MSSYQANFKKYTLRFKQPAGTSRGYLKTKDSWFLSVWKKEASDIRYYGECSLIEGLSPDPVNDLEEVFKDICQNIDKYLITSPDLLEYPAANFALEMVSLDIQNNGPFRIFENAFSKGKQPIPINGLIWMGSKSFMLQQIKGKLQSGFSCIKIKVGTLDLGDEINILNSIRKEYTSNEVQLRLDANGAFRAADALEILKRLSDFEIHSIEQPIMPDQIEDMALLCEKSPIDIALDEELIRPRNEEKKRHLLQTIHPKYIILKPSLLGGFKASDQWIKIAEDLKIAWWITSALESNIGLNAIAQYTAQKDNSLPQGLGTGSLFENNFESPLYISGEHLHYDLAKEWSRMTFS